MKKTLAPPPGQDSKGDKLEKKIVEQRREARQRAERKRRSRLAEKKQAAVETLAQAISEMSSMAQEAASSIAELESTFAELGSSSDQISASTEESVSIVTQTAANVNRASSNTRTSLKMAESLQASLGATSDGIMSLVSGVNQNLAATRETTGLLDMLEEQTTAIENTVGGVMRISDEINLNALNAAIEASRAGEHGIGFSIVADEIRKLAESTEKVAGQILGSVGNVRESVNQVKTDLTRLLEQAESDSKRADEIYRKLGGSAQDMETVRAGSSDIDNLLGVHASEMGRILENSEMIAAGSNQIAASLQQAFSSLQQQVKGLESINKNAEDIELQIEALGREEYTENAAEEVATSAEELSAIIEESSAAIQQIVSAIDEISQSAGQQADSAAENGRLADVVARAAEEIKAKAGVSLEKTLSQQKLLSAIKSEASAMIDGIAEMGDAYLESSAKIKSLHASISTLERAVGRLSNANILTQLLAVNGRIESARAGEHGEGFASVSEDIRELVEQSADHIAEVGERIRAVQDTLTSIAADVEAAGVKVRQESEAAKASTARLDEQEKDMADVAAKVREVLGTATQSLEATEIIKNGIDTISQSAEQAGTACQEAAAAASQQSDAMTELAGTAEEIAAQADAL